MKKLHIITVGLITVFSSNAANWPLSIATAGIAATTAIIGYQTAKNYTTLAPLHKKVQSEHILLGNARAQSSPMYHWKRDLWPTARAMKHDRENVKRAFSAAFVNKELVIYDAVNVIICQPTWLDIKAALNREKDELRKDLMFLENNFLTINPILPHMNKRGFMYDYKAACKNIGVDPYANMSWSEAQEQNVEKLVREMYGQKLLITFGLPNMIAITGFNYSLAASIYWRLFKLFKRLEVLEDIVSELAVGYDAVYARQQESNVNILLQ